MAPIKKKIVTDEAMNPVAVLIDYQDWKKIEKILEERQQSEEFSLSKYAGVIELTEEPLECQKRVRDEWQ
ncbi:hypothetical protein [Kamptonema formosum]|uniref:hypothetical protein n=1 Tax=Kamptonema formosum TaxID=331992 RepID=UPI0003476AA9|nr:hypothetical protein [Oscillatoria sp. PCC 10802]